MLPEPANHRLIAALVRARKTRFKLGSLVCMANPERALNCASYLNSATPGLCGGDFNGRFWNAPLQHRVRFGWRADFHVVRGFVQADARAPTGSAKPQLLTRIVLRPRWARSVATAIPNGADPTCTVTVPSTFPWSVLVRQNPISGSAGSPLHGGRFRVYAWRRAVDCAPYLILCFCGEESSPAKPVLADLEICAT